MDFEDKASKTYCMKKKHVIIICGVIVALGLILGLALGLGLKPPECSLPEDNGQTTTKVPTVPTPEDTDPCPAQNDDNSGDWTNFKLSPYVDPNHYDLELKPDMGADHYDGTVNISITLNSHPTKHIWLHIRETKITEMPLLQTSSGQSIPLKRCFEYNPQEYVVIEAEEELSPNFYFLSMKFRGHLNGSLVGFYRTTYVENGITKSIAATDHEPTDARKSFPCFDEPNKKATYTISIIHEKSYQALSNMSLSYTWNISGFITCFSFKQLRIYAQPQQIHTAEYAADVTEAVFNFFEDYFNMTYSLPKLDKIAIPDFGTGAMENWGLITYRETNLLYDPQESAASNKQRVAAVVAHELVHQWFGNIVTMDWWDDLWLNEGFASFFEFLGVNAAEKDWQMLDQILIDDVFPVLKDDSLQSSHPIVVDVSSPDEITSVFDGISYSKGASILRMLEDWISPEKFKYGCQIYLKKYTFLNARTSQFWKAMEEASGQPVEEVMDTWTRQMGYPLLSMHSNLTVTQKRFLLDPKADPSQPSSDFGYRWNIPVKWYEGSTTDTIFYNKSETAAKDPVHSSNLLINNCYWLFKIDQVLKNYFPFHTFLRARLLNYAYALNLTRYLKNENEYIPWQRAIVSVSYIGDMLQDDDTLYPKFQEYFRSLVKPIADQLEWKNDGDHINSLLRTTVLEFACDMNDPEALSNASRFFDEWLKGASIDVNLRLLVYRFGMQHSGNEQAWEYMFEKYQTTALAQEKEKLLYGLASVKNITLLDRFLKCIYNTTLIKSQDVFNVLRYISLNSYGKTMVWDWVRLNWEYLVSRYTLNDRNLGRLPSRITGTFNTELQLWQMENFFEKYPNAGAGEASRKQAAETVKSNIEWLKQHREELAVWFGS
uniref:Aminopeptidase n=1 Tax=Anolis carolinensis TaxID=28377 RepID=A0A803TTY1_ANOCA